MKRERNNIKCGNLLLIFTLFLFLIILGRGLFLSMSKTVDGINLSDFSSKRTTQKDINYAKRGTIYDVNGNVLAQNVYSYTLIAYLSPSRTTDINKPKHVVDINYTAKQLATVLDLEEIKIKEYLSKSDLYQTEFGSKGKGLNQIVKDKIIALNLPGIDFIESQKRYYPNGNFLSYTVGYAKTTDKGQVIGEMGLEQYFNDQLSGIDGYTIYQKDLRGYKIPNTKEVTVDSVQGKDVYLTIDNDIQFFIEQAIKNSAAKYTFENMTIMIADAKTGKILGNSVYPSFDPNVKEITNYLDLSISVPFESGSTMKIFTYMAALENGNYNGNDTFKSGVYVTKDGTEIGDSNRKGWGTISYDKGFALSSNVGIINLLDKYINGDILKEYFYKLGFGQKTGIQLPKESAGKIDFKYETEIFNAGFGQGITSTPIQYVKALTSIGNNGMLLEPYIVEKIVDPTTNEVLFQGNKTELGQVASLSTVNKMKELMKSVINEGTGSSYKLEGYDIIGKTGTAQIASTNGSGYLPGANDVIRGFAGVFPGDDPKYVIYASMKKPTVNSAAPLSNAIKEIIKNLAKHDNMNIDNKEIDLKTITLDSYYNKNINEVKEDFNTKKIQTVIIGDGNKIINQYPYKDNTILTNDKVFLITNSANYKMSDLNNWSKKDVITYCTLLNLKCEFEGTGFVISQSIKVDTTINKETPVLFKLEEKKGNN